jgi:arylsulfatase A-like enzyme
MSPRPPNPLFLITDQQRADIPQPPNFDDDLTGRPAIYRRIQRVWDELAWADFAQATACYYANCTMIDAQIGRILVTLADLNMTENTLIVFTSDHGDYMGEHRLALKGIPAFEGAYRVPLILAGPTVPAGRRVDELERMAARMWQIIRQTGDFNMTQAQYGMFRFAPVGPEPLHDEENDVR